MNKEIEIELQKFVIEYTTKKGRGPSIDELNLYMSNLVDKMNRQAKIAFEGYSPEDMNYIIYHPWGENSILHLNTLQDADFEKIPLLKQVRHLIAILLNDGKIKLTTAGYLPPKIVKELYAIGIPDELIEDGIVKLNREDDSFSAKLTRIMIKMIKVAKEQKGVMTLTVLGKKMASNPQLLLQELLNLFCTQFNWSYFDLYDSVELGRTGAAFSLILVKKYGKQKRSYQFYANKYFAAFPMFQTDPAKDFDDTCYTLRSFERFMLHFGLINIEERGKRFQVGHTQIVVKTALFDRMISITAPSKR